MNQPVTNELIYSGLQKMRGDLSELKFDVRDLKTRMTMVDDHLGSSISAIPGVKNRLDRMSDGVERIDRRLDLTDHH